MFSCKGKEGFMMDWPLEIAMQYAWKAFWAQHDYLEEPGINLAAYRTKNNVKNSSGKN
jgi:hypothetical protein